jgi:hypothetical protein
MPKKTKKGPTRLARPGSKAVGRSKPRRATKEKPPATSTACTDMAAKSQRFVSDLLIRGEAKKRDRKGRLPLAATHAITKQKPDGSVEVERVRFKTF